VLSLLTGARTEELRALTCARVDLDGRPYAEPPIPPSIEVWRSVREGGDTKTKKSRRTLALPQRCVDALREHLARRDEVEADEIVFATSRGTLMQAVNVRQTFRLVVKAAGLNPDDWTPRELHHSFVLILSDDGVALDDIADLCGHAGTSVTEKDYRHQLRPVLLRGAIAIDRIFPGSGDGRREAGP
jgi:integrase